MGQRLHRCAAQGCRVMIALSEVYCSQHAALNHRRVTDKTYDNWRKTNKKADARHRFYKTKAWQITRRQILERDHGLCQYCLLSEQLTPADMVDHIVPRELDQSIELDETNLISCCYQCHVLKTKWEQNYYGTGTKNTLKVDAPKITDYRLLAFVFERKTGGLGKSRVGTVCGSLFP